MSHAAYQRQREIYLQPPSSFESAGDRERRQWSEHSGDYAFAVLLFLRGLRAAEISIAEIITTQTYARSTQLEKDTLRFVCGQSEDQSVGDGDRLKLIERDQWLMNFVDGKNLGHRDWVTEVRVGMPAHIQRAQKLDAELFPQKQFPTRPLFRWIWDAPAIAAAEGDYADQTL